MASTHLLFVRLIYSHILKALNNYNLNVFVSLIDGEVELGYFVSCTE